MKTIQLLLSTALFLIFSSAIAQELPKDGAALKLKAYSLTIAKGETATTELSLIRSKKFRKATFDTPVVQATAGIKTEILPLGNDLFSLAITPEDIAPGQYFLIVKGTGKWGHSVKSAMFTLNVGEGKLISVNP